MGRLIRYHALLLMVLSIGLSTQGGLVVQALFHLRQGFIATHLCENRANPEMKCHGKCFLKKHLHEAEQQRKQTTSSPTISPVFHFLVTGDIVLPPSSESGRLLASPYDGTKQDGVAMQIDPPPRAA